MSIGSLYQYFPNKDAILHALMTTHVNAGADLIRQRLSEGLPPELSDTLRIFVRATIDNHRDNPRLHRVLFEEAPRAPVLLDHLRDMERQVVDATAMLLEQRSGATSSRLRAQIVVATIESLVHRLITAPVPVDPQQLEDEIVTLLSGYLDSARSSDADSGEH